MEHPPLRVVLLGDFSRSPGERRDVAREVSGDTFAGLLAELRPERNLAYTPLFQVMFNLLNFPPAEASLAGLTMAARPVDTATSKYDLSLYFLDDGGAPLRGFFEYASALFDRTTIRRFEGQYQHLLKQALGDPEVRLADLSPMSPAERHAVLFERDASLPLSLVLTAVRTAS